MLQTLMWRSLRLSVASVVLAGAGHVLAQSLPPPVEAALGRAQIGRDAVSLYVAPVEGRKPARLAWQAMQAMNPASVMKLVTTLYAEILQMVIILLVATPSEQALQRTMQKDGSFAAGQAG